MSTFIDEGKSKERHCYPEDERMYRFVCKNMVTWYDQFKSEMEGKGVLINRVNAAVMEFLARQGEPVAFHSLDRSDPQSFLARKCDMLPFEVVATGIVDERSSYMIRHPEFVPDEVLGKVPVDVFLKTSGKVYRGRPLPKDDPLLIVSLDGARAYMPRERRHDKQEPIFFIPRAFMDEEIPGHSHLPELKVRTRRVFEKLQPALKTLGIELYDFKLEYGIAIDSGSDALSILLADTLSPDEWRARFNGERTDKEIVRREGERGIATYAAWLSRIAELCQKLN